MTNLESRSTRRGFMLQGAALGAAALAARAFSDSPACAADEPASKPSAAAPDVTPTEDLMREHGVLRRVLLIQDELLGRLADVKQIPAETLTGTTGIIRKFIQDYHEKLEEDFIFPLFRKADKVAKATELTDLVKTLKGQHDAGRKIVDQITLLAKADALKDKDSRGRLADSLRQFARMYRPHAAREDTVLFPALFQKDSIMTAAQFAEMGDKFEDKEQELFGKNGFEKIVAEVAGIEKTLGIEDLNQFTPGGG